ncbi:hypothetical protein [Desulfoferrobacter suflitae]|uniref:hypothetical protein n=1 Tax=Desulfoferrobacter suflitae TaxID=2865782 RepID=UPI0021642F69|nr:hypothetical protein [Desulfoferrobacter suflitae]MCK8602875.1 hypothetical protein [Desulfoferrobacter suflitae]
MKCGSDFFPKLPFTACFLPCRAKYRTRDLLNLVNEKGRHHKGDKNHAEELFTRPVVMFQVVALVFEGIKGFILHFPTGTPSSHDLTGVAAGDLKIGNPAEAFAVIAP